MTRRDFFKQTMIIFAGATVALPALHIFSKKGASALAPSTVYAAEKLNLYSATEGAYIMTDKVIKSNDEWRKLLTPEQYHILREKGTERSFTGTYDKHYQSGIYQCAGCRLDLYSSKDKFDSGTGWPSFSAPVAAENVATEDDFSFFMRRTELLCARCDGHLGHVFDDGPKPTGKRHCINSVSLVFVAAK